MIAMIYETSSTVGIPGFSGFDGCGCHASFQNTCIL